MCGTDRTLPPDNEDCLAVYLCIYLCMNLRDPMLCAPEPYPLDNEDCLAVYLAIYV